MVDPKKVFTPLFGALLLGLLVRNVVCNPDGRGSQRGLFRLALDGLDEPCRQEFVVGEEVQRRTVGEGKFATTVVTTKVTACSASWLIEVTSGYGTAARVTDIKKQQR